MAVIQRVTATTAGETVDNVLTGSAFEFIRARSVVQMAIVSDDTDSFATIQIGPRVLAEEFVPKQTAADFPVIPDDFYYAGGALPGDRLVIRVRNADAAAAINFYTIVQITEV